MLPIRTIRPLPVVPGLLVVLLTACAGDSGVSPQPDHRLDVSSDDLEQGARVPVRFTCEGDDVAPHLAWGNPPEGTVEVVVIVDDPDAPGGTFTHWTVWGLEPGDELPGGMSDGAVEGRNDFGSVGYRGPCPPPGDEPHRYRFRVLAVDRPLGLDEGAPPVDVAAALEGHVLGEGVLEARFGR
jgi:Raf kinase inhibitor-like YbhB/YbcL family protein